MPEFFGTFFCKVIAPKICKYVLENHILCMFFGIFFIIIIKIIIISIIIIISTMIIIIGILFRHTRKMLFLTSGGKMTKLPEFGGGGG